MFWPVLIFVGISVFKVTFCVVVDYFCWLVNYTVRRSSRLFQCSVC